MWWQTLINTVAFILPARVVSRLSTVVAASMVIVVVAGVFGSPATAHTFSGTKKARRHVVRRALSQVGVKYNYGEESPKKGFDCSGLTMWAYAGHGASLPHNSLMQYQLAGDKGYKRINKRKNLVKGDLVAFKTSSAKVGHVGIYIGGGEFVSATPSSGVTVDEVDDPYYWGDRWVGATRVLR